MAEPRNPCGSDYAAPGCRDDRGEEWTQRHPTLGFDGRSKILPRIPVGEAAVRRRRASAVRIRAALGPRYNSMEARGIVIAREWPRRGLGFVVRQRLMSAAPTGSALARRLNRKPVRFPR